MSKETTLYDYVQLADKPYGFDKDEPDAHNNTNHTLPNHIKELTIPFGDEDEPTLSQDSSAINIATEKDYDANYYGLTQYNEATNEVFISNRGSYTTGDKIDWVQVGTGFDTGQTAIAKRYAEEVVKYIASNKEYAGVTITFLGDSYGATQAQSQLQHINKLIEEAEEAESKDDTKNPYASISQIRGIGTVAPGVGAIEADDNLNFLTINVVGDKVGHSGGDQTGFAELDIDTGLHGLEESHLIKNTLNYLKNAPSRDWTHDQATVNAFQTDFSAIEKSLNAKLVLRDKDMLDGQELKELNEEIEDYENSLTSAIAKYLPTFTHNSLVTINDQGERLHIELPGGNVFVAIQTSQGSWLTDEQWDYQEYQKDFKEDVTDPFDPENDGVGVWDGTIDSINKSDEDSIWDQIDQLSTTDSGGKTITENLPDTLDNDLAEIGNYIDNSVTIQVDNNPNHFTLYPDGKIVESPTFAGDTLSTEGNKAINSDNLPQTKEDLLTQLETLGLSPEKAEELAAHTTLGYEDLDTENAEFSGFGEEQQQADNLDGLADPLDNDASVTVNAPQLSPEQMEAAHQRDVDAARDIREADLEIMRSQNDLEDAINSGDGLSIAQAGIDYYSALDDLSDQDVDNKNDQTEAVLDVVSSGISLGQSIDSGDGWGIASDSIDLIQDIDNYLGESGREYQNIVNDKSSALLGTAAAGIDLAIAIDSGDDLDKTSAGVDLAATLTKSTTLCQVGSIIGLAQSIASYDDALASGDAAGIGIATATVANDAVNSYNTLATLSDSMDAISFDGGGYLGAIAAGAQLADGDTKGAAITTASTNLMTSGNTYMMAAGVGIQIGSALGVFDGDGVNDFFENPVVQFETNMCLYGNPYTGAAAAVMQLMQGDIQGAAISAATTALLCMGPYGWAAAAVLTVCNMLFSDDSPPEATASFTLDANGNVVMDVSGDDAMQDSAQTQGNAMISQMQDYKSGGGRLLIDGHLPSFTVTQGEDSSINYHSETGGKAAVILDDSVSQAIQLRGVLIARDRGERVESAVKVATNSSGDIDFSRVDQIMAGHGFVKKGMNYTYGETTERYGTSVGTGVMVGGGNVGPEGQHFTAKASDFISLPLRTSQTPSQQLGEISRIVSLKNIFSGTGSELLAMALTIPGGLLALASTAEGGQIITETDNDYTKPLDAVELATYLRGVRENAQPVSGATAKIGQEPLPAIDNLEQMQKFLSEHWADLLLGDYTVPGLDPDSAYHYRESIGYNGLFSDGSAVPPALWDKDDDQSDVTASMLKAGDSDTQPVDLAATSFTGCRIGGENGEKIPEELVDIKEGAVFLMAEDSTLRFLPSELTRSGTPNSYSIFEEEYTIVGFGTANNGRVWQDDNGDIRFEPAQGFVGTSSFNYTLKSPDGELVEQVATVLVKNVNDAPLLTDDNFTLEEGETLYLDRLLDNDSDPEGDILQFDHFHGLEHGSLSVIGGRLAFVPDEGYFGDVEFSYWVRDHATSYPAMGQVNIHYVDSNTGVQPEDDHFIILEESSLTTSKDKLLENDVEHDGETIVFTGLGAAVHGEVIEAADGDIIFTPEPDYTGSQAGFFYNVEDGSGNPSTGWAGLEVLDIREAPVVISSTHVAIAEDGILPFTPEEIATFVYDPDGDDLHLEFITNVTGGTISFTDGVYSFIPDTDFSGRASFDYQANDNHRGVVSGHLEFDVTPVNDPIDTGSDRLTTQEEQAVTTTVAELLADDTDVDGSVADFVALGAARNGQVSIDGAGKITFTPDIDYAGSDAGFEYVVADSEGLESTGWVDVEVSGVNDTPLVAETHLNLREDTVLTFNQDLLKNLFTEVDGDSLSITSIEALEGGTVHEVSGVYTFRPDSDYNGDGKIQLSVTDNMGAVAESTVSLGILAVDDPANMGLETLATTEEQAVRVSVAELLAAGSDADGALTFAGLGDSSHGSVSLSDSAVITFIPNANYSGNEAGFNYRVQDAKGGETTATVTVEVTGSNDPPTIITNSLEATEDTPIIFNQETITKFISDLDGDNIVLTDLSSAASGTVSESGGIYTFTPDPEYHGPAILSYTATDMNGATVSGKLDLDILSMDDPTSFGTDVFTTTEDQTLITSVSELMVNDTDSDGTGELQFKGLGAASHGQVQLGAGGTVTFVPDENYYGEDAGFAYTVLDSESDEATGWVTVKVSAVNDKPEITGNRIVIKENESLAFNQDELSKFIFDPDGDLLSLDVVTNVEGGRMELSGGVYTFIPDANFYGEASLEFLASDSEGVETPGKLYLGVTPVNDLPTVDYSSGSGIEDNEILFNVADLMSGATDVEDSADLRFGGIDSSVNGDVYVDSDNIAHFVPHKDYFGSGFFRYKVLDSEGGIGLGYVGVDIMGVNDVPVALDDGKILAWSNNSYENVFLAAAFLGNDYDVDGDTLSITSVGGAEFGTVAVDSSGNIHYIADSDDWVGIDKFTYTISDGQGGLSQAVAKVDVKLNTTPDVYSEVIETKEDVFSYISQAELLANDADINGDTMYITGVDQAEHCSVELMTDGRIRFTPELNYNNLHPGQASFRYTVSDGISDPVTAIALFDIDPVNDAPILVVERIAGPLEDNSLAFLATDLLINDTDVEMASAYEMDSITFDTAWGAQNGTLSYNDADGQVYYTPNQNFNGVDTFSYRVVDSHGATTTIQSEIYVTPVNDAPTVMHRIGTPAEETVNNYYSIAELLSKDFDVDGDSLSITEAYRISGSRHTGIDISGGSIVVVPVRGEDSLVIGYTVSDGHGGETASRLTIPSILEHNYAPEFSGLYDIAWKNSYTVWFDFHAEDINGGNNWWRADWGDIATISASAPNTGSLTQVGPSTFKFKGDVENAFLTLTVADKAGASGTIGVRLSHLGKIDGNHHYSPVVLDLDGDGVELMDVAAGVIFDWNLDGTSEKTGWVGQDDGFLVYDYDNDQAVRYANELALKEHKPGANTDLEGLQAFDTNEDGVFDQQDEEWNSFGVWQDKNSNGETDDGEFTSMKDTDITSIELQSDGEFREESGNVIYGETTFHKEDGTVGEVADVGLNGETIEFTEVNNTLEPETLFADESQATENPIISEQNDIDLDQFGPETNTISSDTSPLETTSIPPEDSKTTPQTSKEEKYEDTQEELTTDSISLDEATLNRQLSQLTSDMATSTTPEGEIQEMIFIEPVSSAAYVDPSGEVDQDVLTLA